MKGSDNDILIDTQSVQRFAEKIPPEDFIDVKFDSKKANTLTDIMIIFSTPRSGSTFLSDLIHKNDVCLPHEYFQPFNYLPVLADRWACIENGKLDKQKYLSRLIQYRTSKSGWLGINIHGEHLPTFSHFEEMLPEVNFHYIHVIRANNFAQAISYEIAIQTGKWSSHFQSSDNTKYDFHQIKSKLDRIYLQNNLIDAFVRSKGANCQKFYYEDIVQQPIDVLRTILPVDFHNNLVCETNLTRQSSKLNADWLQKFMQEYLDTEGKGYEADTDASSNSFKRKLKKFMNI